MVKKLASSKKEEKRAKKAARKAKAEAEREKESDASVIEVEDLVQMAGRCTFNGRTVLHRNMGTDSKVKVLIQHQLFYLGG